MVAMVARFIDSSSHGLEGIEAVIFGKRGSGNVGRLVCIEGRRRVVIAGVRCV
jgi:hypothetical protein